MPRRYLTSYCNRVVAMGVKVSVIIPVYNTASLLARCLESVAKQSLRDIEIICVDDGSTDGSGAMLDSWAVTEGRMRVIHQANGRQGKARNAGMAIATGEYIGFIDSDDYIPADYFERLYEAACEADADIAMCGIVKEKRSGNRTVIAFKELTSAESIEEKLRLAKCPPEFHPVNKLYRREMLRRIDLRFMEGVQYEDVLFVTRALCESHRLVVLPGLYYRYVLNPTSTVKSRQTAAKQEQKYRAHRSMVDYLRGQGVELAAKHRNITVRYHSVAGVCLWKIKELDGRRTLRLFDILPILSWRR